MTSQEPADDFEEEVLTTPATPGAAALPSVESDDSEDDTKD